MGQARRIVEECVRTEIVVEAEFRQGLDEGIGLGKGFSDLPGHADFSAVPFGEQLRRVRVGQGVHRSNIDPQLAGQAGPVSSKPFIGDIAE